MTIVDVFSVLIGSAVILVLIGSIAIEGLNRRGSKKKKVVHAIDSKWKKIEIEVWPIYPSFLLGIQKRILTA